MRDIKTAIHVFYALQPDGMCVESNMLMVVIGHQRPTCTSGQTCLLGLSFAARTYIRSNGTNHPGREGKLFFTQSGAKNV